MKSVISKAFKINAPFPKVELWRSFLWLAVTLTMLIFSVLTNTFVMQILVGSQDKFAHVIIFLGFFLFTKFLIKNLSLFKISLITFVLGILIELLQAYFTHGSRQFDLYDVLFNLLGIALGLLLMLVYRGVENGKEASTKF